MHVHMSNFYSSIVVHAYFGRWENILVDYLILSSIRHISIDIANGFAIRFIPYKLILLLDLVEQNFQFTLYCIIIETNDTLRAFELISLNDNLSFIHK